MTDAGSDSDAATDVAIADAAEVYLQRKAVSDGSVSGSGSGAYATKAGSILRRFAEWIERERGVVSLAALDADHMRAYALELCDRVDRGEYTASTAGTYYAVVRAFLSWCVRGGIVPTNPAATDRAESALPSVSAQPADGNGHGREHKRERDHDHKPDHNLCTNDSRRTLETYVRERALDADRDDPAQRRNRLREYAMVAVLAHSDVRGAELFRVPEDDRRTGATWDDVDFYAGTIRVLGKSQRDEDVTLLAPARTPLRRYGVVLDPPANDWPLFPTRHAPSIARRVRETLRERGYDEDEIEQLCETHTATQLARERAIAPPAITTEGARSVLKRLCTDAGLETDGDYLTPRGVRGDRDMHDDRREATRSKPTLRASRTERSIAVPRDRHSKPVDGGGSATRSDKADSESTDD